jgi:tetratricopeptide (TPR) repeat protein
VLDYGAGVGSGAVEAVARGALGIPAGADGEAAGSAVAAAIAAGLVRAGDAVFFNDLLGLPQPAALRALRQAMDDAGRARGRRRALKRLVERSSAVRPQLVVVEDLHAADEATLATVLSLASVTPGRPVMLLVTARVEGDPIDRTWLARAGEPSTTIIDLGPLAAADALALARGLAAADEGMASTCAARSGGNPLFLEQLIQHAGEGAGSGVPGSVVSLVQARLDRLAAADRAALQAAAVLGHGFAREDLDRIVGGPYDPAPLLARRFLRRRGERLAFGHALIRDAVYGMLLKSRRRTLHRRAAALFAGRDGLLHAEHLTLAEDPAAADANLAAARAELGEHRPEAALRLAERALDTAAAPAERFAAHSLLGGIRFRLGNIPEARSAAEKAVRLAADGGQRATALIDLAAIRRTTDDVDGALAALAEAEGLAASPGLTAEAARLHQLRATVLFPRGEIDTCLAENLKSLELARAAASPELEAGALAGLGDAEYMRGRMKSALARFRHAVEVCRAHGFGRIEVATLPMLALAEVFAATAPEALISARAAITLARAVGPRYEEIIAHQTAILCYAAIGDDIAAANHAERALSLARHLGARRFQAECLALRAGLHCRAGRRQRARADASQALAICRRGEAMRYIGPTVLGVLAMASEDARAREKALEEGEAALAGSVSHNHFWFLRDGIELRLAEGNQAGARRYAEMLEDYTREEPLPWSDAVIASVFPPRSGLDSPRRLQDTKK